MSSRNGSEVPIPPAEGYHSRGRGLSHGEIERRDRDRLLSFETDKRGIDKDSMGNDRAPWFAPAGTGPPVRGNQGGSARDLELF
jgi:hypothetical protein